MPRYVKEALYKFQHHTQSRPQHSPHQWNPPNYGSTSPHLAHQAPESPNLAPPEATTVQQVVSIFLYYACAVDTTMLVELNSIDTEQSRSADTTAKAVAQLINYDATHSEAITIYHANGIILHIHSNASFL